MPNLIKKSERRKEPRKTVIKPAEKTPPKKAEAPKPKAPSAEELRRRRDTGIY